MEEEHNQPTANSEESVQHSHEASQENQHPKPKHQKKQAPAKPAVKKNQEEDLSLNFGFMKNLFKSKSKAEPKKEHVEKTSESKEDISMSFDPKSIWNAIWKYKVILLILIPLIASIYVRMPSESLPITDEWATNAVVGYFKAQISSQVNQQYPNLPDQNRQALVDQEWQKFIAQNKQTIDQNIAQTSASFKAHFQYEANGVQYTYMPDIDPYFWLRYARNYIETGHLYDEIKNGIEWDNHMQAPFGLPAQTVIHTRIIAWIYKIMSMFNPKITLMQAAGYLPIIFSALTVIPAFFIGRRVGGNVGGFFSAAMVAISPSFVSRTPWGHADTDAYNVLFPLMIIWIFIESYEAKSLKNKILIGALAGLTTAVYAKFWEWWYVFDFVIAATGLYILYTLFIYRNELKKGVSEFIKTPAVKNALLIALTYFIATGIFVTMLASFTSFVNAVKGPIGFLSIKAAAQQNLWPNVYTTVAELNEVDIAGIINSMGGKLLFWISLLGIILSFLKRDEHGKRDIKYAFLLAIWFVGTMYASTKGIRFTLLLVPAFGVAFGIALGMAFQYITRWGTKQFEIHKAVTGSILAIVFVLLLVAPARASYSISYHDVPIVNDVWWNSLTKIKDNSQPNAIITSWWDFGHHFKFIADRPVTFDGGSQNSPQAHWVGKLLLTSDEKTSIGILKMLDCGANSAFDEVDKKLNDTSLSVDTINNIIVQDKAAAKQTLKDDGFNDQEADDVLKFTHCNPPEAFLITSDDMVGKGGVWAHFGSWDFRRAEIWTKVRKMPRDQAVQFMLSQKDYRYTKDQAEKIYAEVQSISNDKDANSWISPWPNYMSGLTGCSADADNASIKCSNGVQVNLTTEEAFVPTQQGYVHPHSLVYMKDNKLVEKVFPDSTQGYSVIFINNNGLWTVISDNALSDSMFTRLFFMQGKGLSYYQPFYHEKGPTGTDVYVWKVNWNGQ